MIENDIRTALLQSDAIKALVGTDAVDPNGSAARIYYNTMIEGRKMPAINIFQVSGIRGRTIDGPDGWNRPRFQIDCFSPSFTECRTLWDAMRLQLDGYVGTGAQNAIASITIEGEQVFYESEANPKLHRVSSDALVWVREIRR